MMFTSDFHMHTSFSTDSNTPPEEMIKACINKGLTNICITDHYDMDFPFDPELGENAFLFDVDKYVRTLSVLKEKYKDKIDVGIGVELGLQPHLGQFYKEFVKKYPFDFTIGSVHLIDGQDPYSGKIFENRSDDEVYRHTFELTLENIKKIKDFDVLGHIDYVVRYGKTKNKYYSYEKYKDIIDEILKYLIYNGKGIEMNMAGFKYGLGHCHPHPDIIKRYRELGGEIITVGSDGHAPDQVAYDYDKVRDILEDCGFNYYTNFRQRKAYFHKIQ